MKLNRNSSAVTAADSSTQPKLQRQAKHLHFSDHLEKQIAQALSDVGIDFVHESENKEQELDFYLPFFDVYIEVKQFHADRIARQMSSKDNVIAVQGRKSVELLIVMLMHG